MDKFDEFEDLDEFDEETVIITDEDGNEQELFIIDTISHKGNVYLLVTPADADADDDEEEFEAIIIKQTGEDSENNLMYSLIDDDNEFNEAAALFMENEGDYEIEV